MGVEKALAPAAAASSYSSSNDELLRCSRSFNKPSWLLVSVADLDQRMKMIASNASKEDKADSFAKQAEAYYQKRPQLLSLLQDLYNGYLSLADRYCRTLAKQHSPLSIKSFHLSSDEEICSSEIDNECDAESSVSFQPPLRTPIKNQVITNADQIFAELVIKNVECEIIVDEMSGGEEKRWNESSRKIELQKSLLEVMESERLILLNENTRLEYRVGALAEENKGLEADSLFMKRKAGELARCMLKLREDHRVCMLSRKIEDLHGQIHVLEKRNKEYCEQLVKQEEKKKSKMSKKMMKRKRDGEVTIEDSFQVDDEEAGSNVIMKCRWWRRGGGSGGGSEWRVSKLWDKVKNFDMLLCGPHYNSACC